MKRIQSVHQLIAIALIAWLVVPICCCTGMNLGKESEGLTRSCCQTACDLEGDSDSQQAPECPCGKRTLTEGKSEISITAPAVDSFAMISAAEWISETTPPLAISSGVLLNHLDLPPPGTTWFALSGSWLL